MKIILNKDVKNVGKAGDIVNVKDGFARNYLIPRRLGEIASQGRSKYWQHIQNVITARKKKALEERKNLITQLNNLAVTFYAVTAVGSEKIFGTITTHDISTQLEKMGFLVDRRDIFLEESIKALGNYKATVKFNEGLQAQLQIIVERQKT